MGITPIPLPAKGLSKGRRPTIGPEWMGNGGYDWTTNHNEGGQGEFPPFLLDRSLLRSNSEGRGGTLLDYGVVVGEAHHGGLGRFPPKGEIESPNPPRYSRFILGESRGGVAPFGGGSGAKPPLHCDGQFGGLEEGFCRLFYGSFMTFLSINTKEMLILGRSFVTF